MTLSRKRQAELREYALFVQELYVGACHTWGQQTVDADLTRIWDLRCHWGMSGRLPFAAMRANLGEVLWIAREVCGLGKVEP